MITEGRLLPQVQSALAQLLREPTPEFIGQLREFVQERAGLNATPEIMKKALHALMEPPHEAPAHVKPESASIEGNSLTVQNWIDVLVGTAKWLLRQGKQLPVDKKLPGRGGRVLISRQPNRLKSAKQIAKDLYIEANWSAEGCVNCARWLLESCGYSRGDLVVTPRIA